MPGSHHDGGRAKGKFEWVERILVNLMSDIHVGQVAVSIASVKQSRIRRQRLFRKISPYLLIFPSVALMAVVILVPLVRGILMSFSDVNIIKQGEMHFIGLQNYVLSRRAAYTGSAPFTGLDKRDTIGKDFTTKIYILL